METVKIENLKSLSQSAMEAGSYKDAYKYSSSLIEIDPTLNEAWLIKAVSAAGLMADNEDVSLEEVLFCLDRGTKGASAGDIKNTSNMIKTSYKEIIKKLDAVLKEKMIDHHKVPMPNGGSIILHRLAQVGYARLTAKGLAPKRLKAIKLLEKSYNLNPDEDNLKFLISEVASFLSHSSEFSKYLDDESEIKSYLLTLSSALEKKAEELGIRIVSSPQKQSGCFIATAATGSYDHPKVITLRLFRDSILKNHPFGMAFINFYYKISPPIANWIKESEKRKQIALWLIVNPLSKLAAQILKTN